MKLDENLLPPQALGAKRAFLPLGVVCLSVIFCSCLIESASARNLDTNFNASASGGAFPSVRGIALQPDGKILVAGAFTTLSGHSTIGVGRLNPDGSPDTNFTANASTDVFSMFVQTNGKIVIGGSFGTIDGQSRAFLGRLNANGSLDTNFTTGADLFVRCMAPQADGKIIVVGSFFSLGGSPHLRIARIGADGEIDNTFNPAASGENHTVWTAAVQTDGKILVGGAFTNLSGAPRRNIGRLNSDGSLDDSFDPGAEREVDAIAVQPDGKILVGGSSTNLGGQVGRRLERLNPDGSLDASLNYSNASIGGVTSIALQSGGKILLADGNNAYQINPADGQVDALIAPAPGSLRAVTLQRDGKVLLGGNFTMVGGAAHSYIARLLSEGETQESLEVNADGSTVTWSRAGSGSEVQQVTFEHSFDGAGFMPLGVAARINGGWQVSGLSLPTNQTTYVRARGRTVGGLFNGSSGLIESVKQFPLPSVILQLGGSAVLGNGTFQFSISNNAAVNFSIFATTNLSLSFSNWTELAPPTPVGNGVFQFTDFDATNFPRRFYQLRKAP